jgi:hypothetical protein
VLAAAGLMFSVVSYAVDRERIRIEGLRLPDLAGMRRREG